MIDGATQGPRAVGKKWDVAISFAVANEAVASQLRDALVPPHSVFLYTKVQEHLAGRDGIEAFRKAFRDESSLVVILYAEPWGQTPWTQVEKTAIEELALAEGWDRLIFVRLKRNEKVPIWVPKPHLYLDLATFTIANLAGAIKLRLSELGVETKPVTPAQRAAAQSRKLNFDAETIELLRSGSDHFDEVEQELCEAIRAEASAVASETGWDVGIGRADVLGGFIVTTQGQTVQLVRLRRYTNSVDDAALELREFAVALNVERTNYRTFYRQVPEPVETRRIPIRRSPELGWCWEIDGRLLSPREAAKVVVHTLLDRIDSETGGTSAGYAHNEDSLEPED